MEHSVLLLQADGLQPYKNLAVETYLLENLHPYTHALYLWQNDNTVVVGVNQNAFAEVSPTFNGYVTRRLSGGGAVYHDAGNLNFTFVSAKNRYSVDNNKRIIYNALKGLGLNAEFTGRNDVVIDGKKISGQAYCLRRDTCYHHGTILINSNVERIQAALRPSRQKLESKGVASVASRVGNLVDWNPNITVEQVRDAIAKAFLEFYADYKVDEKRVDYTNPKLLSIAEKLTSKEWIWGRNPMLTNKVESRFEWGTVSVAYEIKGNTLTDIEIFTDAMNTDWCDCLKTTLLQTPVNEWKLLQFDNIEAKDTIQLILV
ncbi:MAG: lipoate--protein ligase [Paludibacteraceae bacterium]|nr:lipoate--protein ligase [Paludibacteraceae bacterium]